MNPTLLRYAKKGNPNHDSLGRFSDGNKPLVIGGDEVPVTQSSYALSEGMSLVSVNVSAFDKAWEGSDTYVGEGGVGGNKGRYENFDVFIKGGQQELIPGLSITVPKATSLEAPDVSVSSSGKVEFVNGRHRYSWLRDNGIPVQVSMTRASEENARKHRLLQ